MTKTDDKDLQKIKDRIFRGQKYWKDENEAKFKRFRNYLKIKHWPNGKPSGDSITVPYIHALLRAKLPFLYYRNPQVIIEPKAKMPSKEIADLTTKNLQSVRAVMDYLPKEIGMEREIKRVVQDATGFGRGVIKIGFEFEYEGGVIKPGIINRTIGKVKDFLTGQQTPTEEDIKILVDRFYCKRVSYTDGFFIYDPEAKYGLSDSRFCAERIIEPLEDVKSNKNFKNTAELKSNCKPENGTGYKDKSEESDEELLEYFVYWPKDKYGKVKKCIYVVPDQDVILWTKEKPYAHEDFPYEELNNYETPDYLFPLGDIQSVEDQQNELDKLETIHFNHAKSFIQKYVYNKGKLDESQLTKLKTADNLFCDISEDSNLHALENPSINQAVPLGTAMLKEDMTKIMAVSEYDTAYIPRTETTLGEAQMVQGGSNNRKADSRKDVEEFAERVFSKLFQVVQEYMTEDVLIQITDEQGVTDWLNKTSDDIQGEYKFTVQPYSASPVDRDKLRKDSIELLKAFANDPTLPLEGKNELRKLVLDAWDIKNTTPFETQTTPPGEEGPNNEPMVDESGKPIQGTPISPQEAMTPPMPPGGQMAPPTPPPEKSPLGPIPYKDLPPSGKVQMAAEAGIQLDPNEIMSYELAIIAANKPEPKPEPVKESKPKKEKTV